MYTRVFSFNADETDGIRENYNQHGIKILNVSNDGNCDFIVYGYMNRGEHEGESGVSLCKYSYEDNIVEERLYIPMDKPYDILSQNVGRIAYLADENTFYILMDDTLYSIDIVSKEVMTVVSGLVDGTYAVSENGDAIAYSMNGRLYSTDSIRIFNMSTDSEKIIKAHDNEYIRCLGYINGDFVYGIADKADILIKEDGSRTFAMYRLEIMDPDYNVIKEYEQPGVYVSDASVSDMRINLTRVMKSGDGDYESTSIDQLINKDENKQEDGLTLETIVTDNRKQELAIKLMKALPAGSVEFRTSSEVSYKDNALLELDNDFAGDGRYYVYGYGRFQDSTTQISKAIILANDTYGSVNDYNANTIWKRYRNTSAQIKGLSIIDAGSSLRTALQTVASYAGAQFDINAYIQDKTADEILSLIPGVAGLSVKSVTVDKMLNFIDNGCPVIGKSVSDGNADENADGYTNLEEYLNWLAEPHFTLKQGESVTIDMKKYFAGYTNNPQFECEAKGDAMSKMSNNTGTSDSEYIFTANEDCGKALVDYTVKVSDDDNISTYTRTFHFYLTDGSATGIQNIQTSTAADSYEVYNAAGIKVRKGKNLDSLPSGVYIIKALKDGKVISSKKTCIQ